MGILKYEWQITKCNTTFPGSVRVDSVRPALKLTSGHTGYAKIKPRPDSSGGAVLHDSTSTSTRLEELQ